MKWFLVACFFLTGTIRAQEQSVAPSLAACKNINDVLFTIATTEGSAHSVDMEPAKEYLAFLKTWHDITKHMTPEEKIAQEKDFTAAMNKYQLLMQERQIKQTAGLFVGVVAGLMAAGFMWYVVCD